MLKMTQNYETLPENLPIPEDDGACDHLVGMSLPEFDLPSTGGDLINLSKLKGKVVIYCYPMTGKPGVPLPEGWDQIPGARGCTPQSCSFRDHYAELQSLGAGVFGFGLSVGLSVGLGVGLALVVMMAGLMGCALRRPFFPVRPLQGLE